MQTEYSITQAANQTMKGGFFIMTQLIKTILLSEGATGDQLFGILLTSNSNVETEDFSYFMNFSHNGEMLLPESGMILVNANGVYRNGVCAPSWNPGWFVWSKASDRLKVTATYPSEPIWANYFTHLFDTISEAFPVLAEPTKKLSMVDKSTIEISSTEPRNNNDLTKEEKLCIKWAGHNSIPHKDMTEFLYENDSNMPIGTFKRALQNCGKKRLIQKGKNGRWELPPN